MTGEQLVALIGCITGAISTLYAHHAHKSSIMAPLLSMQLHGANGRPLQKRSRDNTVPVFPISADQFIRPDLPPDKAVTMQVPITIRNSGTRTAHAIRLRSRYSALLQVIPTPGSRQVQDPDRSHWIVIDRDIQDLHPRQSITIDSDDLVPDHEWLSGFCFEGTAMSKDKHEMKYKARIDMRALVEFVLYSENADPIVQECAFTIDRKAEPAGGAYVSPVTITRKENTHARQ